MKEFHNISKYCISSKISSLTNAYESNETAEGKRFNNLKALHCTNNSFGSYRNFQIQFLFTAYAPENVAKWAEIRRKEAEGHH